MDKTEQTARLGLREYRRVATQFQGFIDEYRARLEKYPHIEAGLVVSGRYHKYAARWIARMLAAAREQDIERNGLRSATSLTQDNWEETFRQNYSPFGVIQEVVLPLIMQGLHDYEELSIENCWRLPKWKRPEWLKQMERDGQIESSPAR